MMKKKFIVLWLLMLAAIFCSGQSTTVSGTATDSTGQAFINGVYTITFQPVPGNAGPYFWQGAKLTPNQTLITGNLDAAGSFSTTVDDNNFISPRGTKYYINVCPNSNSNCYTTLLPLTGSSINISSSLITPPISVVSTSIPRAYSDAEVAVQFPFGASYFNVISKNLRLWDGTTWQNTGSAIVNVPNTWLATQTFAAGITGTGNTGALTAGTGILGTVNTFTANQSFGAGITGTGNTGALTAGAGILGTANTFTVNQSFAAGIAIADTQPTDIPLIIKSAVGQSANIQQWQNSSGVSLVGVDPTGHFIGTFIPRGISQAVPNPCGSGTPGNICHVIFTISPAYPDANYLITGCTLDGPNQPGLIQFVNGGKTASSFDVVVQEVGSTAITSGNVDCGLIHN